MDHTLDGIRDIKLYQNRKGYRFSVDALLLESFVNLTRAERIADLGAGSGIIGLLLAKKYHAATVALVELQESLVRLAERNIVLNKLEERVRVIRTDIKTLSFSSEVHKFTSSGTEDFSASALLHSFDLIVSNPPFRRIKTGLISAIDEKAIARHEIKIHLADLISVAHYLLKSKGRLCLIYHPSRLVELLDTLRKKHMEPKRLRFVHSNSQTEAKMVLVEAVKEGRAEIKIEKPIYIYKDDMSYTDEMKKLYERPVIQ
ncbi:MAG: tRNA1(Val) (adenine(37)-N6)-methyltransferase [Nitrospirae bacterium]|nr:tRNA1(Val) (adenine(37)-N6)-methyltransferase [Nitrospirota bacterium]